MSENLSVRRSVLLALLFFSTVLVVNVAAAKAVVITVYTDKTAWENALGGQFLTEDFSDGQLNNGVSFASSESGHINPALECYQDVLASESQNDPHTTWSFSPQISAYGGNWDLGGPGGSGNSLLVFLGDSSVPLGFISNSYSGGFWGFTSDVPFASVTLKGGSGIHQQNYNLDDMVYSDSNYWKGPGGGSYGWASNWTANTIPNGVDATAVFPTSITAPSTVYLDSIVTLGSLILNSPHSYSLAGTSVLTLQSSSGVARIDVQAGSHEISAPVAINNDSVISGAGTLSLSGGISGNHPLTVLGNLTTTRIQVDTLTIGIPGVMAIPEPSILALLGTGAFGLLVWTWRRNRKISAK